LDSVRYILTEQIGLFRDPLLIGKVSPKFFPKNIRKLDFSEELEKLFGKNGSVTSVPILSLYQDCALIVCAHYLAAYTISYLI
jgi:hypothetical protein